GFLTGAIVHFGMISLQAEVDPTWGAISWGFGFGIGGAIAGSPLAWLWVPADASSRRVRHAAWIAGLAFSLSGTVAGYLGFLSFADLHDTHGLSVFVWLAYVLGGLLCDVGWNLSLSPGGSTRQVGYREAS